LVMEFKGRGLVEGYVEGIALVSKEPISFLGDIDPGTGTIIRKNHELYSLTIKNKVFVFPYGKGSTVGSYIIYRLRKNNVAPKAILNIRSDPVVIVGCVISDIPLVDMLPEKFFKEIGSGDKVIVDAYKGIVRILK